MVELKTHAGWNTCNPSLLLGQDIKIYKIGDVHVGFVDSN